MKSDPNARKHFCFKCEPLGVKKRADVFVQVDGLLNQEKQPLCFACQKEWKKEMAELGIE